MIAVYILARQPALRAGLHTLLATAEIAVAGEAPGPSALPAGLPLADVVLVAGEELLDATVRLLAGDGSQALLLLADDDRALATLAGLPLRAWGILPPDAPEAELQAAVRAVAEGLSVLPPALAGRLAERRSPVAALVADPLDEPLTGREREVLQLLSQGLPNKRIARELQISEHTVKFHISSLYGKLGAASRTEAVNRGARRGLITL